MSERQYWFNTETGRVESDENLSPERYRLGPYPSEEAARNALQSVRERNERLDAEDEAWENG